MTRSIRRAAVAAALALSLLATACSGGDREGAGDRPLPSTTAAPAPDSTNQSTTATTTAAAADGPLPKVRATEIARLDQPVAAAAFDRQLLVAEKGGRLMSVPLGGGGPVELVRIPVSTAYEQGLLGVAVSPDRRHVYLDYTDEAGDTRVVEYAITTSPSVDGRTSRELLLVDQPFANHNGGQLAFGPDGMLYVALGDGGSGGDPQNNGQRLDTLLGKILRIDPSKPGGSTPYGISAGNPFVGRDGARPEIWAYGLRNPWRFTFDRATGDLWIGDVGQNEREEINFQAAASRGGENYGWRFREGSERYASGGPGAVVAPVHDYSLDGPACAVTGGFVYRGTRIPGLVGAYLFADFCVGDVMALRQQGGRWNAEPLGMNVPQLASFAQDGDGELYAMSLQGPIVRIDPA